MLKTGLVLSSKVATDWFLAMKRYPFLLSQIPSVILEKKCWLKKCIQGDSLKSQAVFLLHSFCNETSSRNFMCAFCHNLRRAIEIIAWKLVFPSLLYRPLLFLYISGASLVRVQLVHLHPLRFAMGAMHPSSGGLFVLRTENQGKLWGFCGS